MTPQRLKGLMENLLVYPDRMQQNLDQLGGLATPTRADHRGGPAEEMTP